MGFFSIGGLGVIYCIWFLGVCILRYMFVLVFSVLLWLLIVCDYFGADCLWEGVVGLFNSTWHFQDLDC